MYIKDQACKRNTGFTFLFCTLECGLAILILGFHQEVFVITENFFIHWFPKIWSSDNRKWYRPAQNHTLRILKLQTLKVKKNMGYFQKKVTLTSMRPWLQSQNCVNTLIVKKTLVRFISNFDISFYSRVLLKSKSRGF